MLIDVIHFLLNRIHSVETYEFFESLQFLIKGDSNEAKIRVAEYSTILFQQGQPRFVYNLKQLSNVFKSNRTGIEPESNGNQTRIDRESNVNRT